MPRLLVLLLAVAPAFAADPPKAKPPGQGVSYAFLVAAAEYDKNELRPLPYSGKETAEFRDVLLKTGFDEANVKLLHDKAERRYLPTRKQIADELDLLLGRAEPDDTVVVLLNGHGVHFAGDATGYFCPVDAKLSDKTTLVPMDGKGGVFELLKGCKAKRKVLLVNACRNDPRSDLSLAGDKIKLDDDDKDEVPEGIAALYSCRPGERSYYYDPTDAKSKGRERSLYMHHLIEAWGKGGNTTLEDVFASVRRNTVTDADALFARKQTPVVRREYKGEGEWLIASVPGKLKERAGGEEVEFEIADGVKMTFCWIPPGDCQLGSPKAEREAVMKDLVTKDEPDWLKAEADTVRGRYETKKGFWLGKYAVTQAEWTAVMGTTPFYFHSEGGGKDSVKGRETKAFPAETVNWDECQDFVKAVNKRVGMAKAFGAEGTFRLPHENEWEYACRGGKGNKQPFYWGDALNGDKANCDGKSPFGTATKGEYLKRPSVVGEYAAKAKHPWGLCDMSGNVWQWCDNYYDSEQRYRVLRGGSWGNYSLNCRSAYRTMFLPTNRNDFIGFRLCFSLDK